MVRHGKHHLLGHAVSYRNPYKNIRSAHGIGKSALIGLADVSKFIFVKVFPLVLHYPLGIAKYTVFRSLILYHLRYPEPRRARAVYYHGYMRNTGKITYTK